MALLGLMLFSVAFAVTHIGMSAEPLRGQMVEKIGEWGFRGLYSVVSFITLGGAIWLFIGHRGAGPVLWSLPWWLYFIPFLLMLIAVPLVVFGYPQPGPSSVIQGSYDIKGIKKISLAKCSKRTNDRGHGDGETPSTQHPVPELFTLRRQPRATP